MERIKFIVKKLILVIVILVISMLLIASSPGYTLNGGDSNKTYNQGHMTFKESSPIELSLLIGNIPVKDDNYLENYEITKIERSMTFLSVPTDKRKVIAYAVKLASRETGINSNMILALMKTESEFNQRAVSPKRYKGLMQTPSASFDYADVDTLHGARILQDKLSESKGNMLEALSLYKGGRNSLARKHALQTYKLYKELEKLQ